MEDHARPIGRHRYFHKLYALDTVLPDLKQPTKAKLEEAMKGHILSEARLMGTYQKGAESVHPVASDAGSQSPQRGEVMRRAWSLIAWQHCCFRGVGVAADFRLTSPTVKDKGHHRE